MIIRAVRDRRGGLAQGQTQLDFPADAQEAVWAHPIDVHYSVEQRVQGWPRFQLQVFQEDRHGRNELVGYGFVHVPSAPGVHEVQCSCWRPVSPEWNDEVQAFFVGGNHDPVALFDDAAEQHERLCLRARVILVAQRVEVAAEEDVVRRDGITRDPL